MCDSKNLRKFEIHGYLTDFKSSCTSPINITADTRIQRLESTEIKNFKIEKFKHALFGLNLPEWKLVTAIETSSENKIKEESKIKIDNFIRSFRLVNPGGIEIRLVSRIDNQIEKFIDATHLRTFEEGKYEFRENDLKNLKNINSQVTQINNTRILNALERFNLSYHDFRFEDKMIDYIIALECLFSDGSGEIAFKLAYRSARLLEFKNHSPSEVFAYMKKAYDHRSKCVHGSKNKFKSENNKRTFSKQLQKYTREILKIVIEKSAWLDVVLENPFSRLN